MNTLTPGTPLAVVIKLLATLPTGGICNAGNGGVPFGPTGIGVLAGGLRAWATTLHSIRAPGVQMTENAFQFAGLSDSENAKLTSYCNFIQADGSGFG